MDKNILTKSTFEDIVTIWIYLALWSVAGIPWYTNYTSVSIVYSKQSVGGSVILFVWLMLHAVLF